MPVSARKQLFDLSDDMATKVNVLFYGDVREALHQGDCGLSLGPIKGDGTNIGDFPVRRFSRSASSFHAGRPTGPPRPAPAGPARRSSAVPPERSRRHPDRPGPNRPALRSAVGSR